MGIIILIFCLTFASTYGDMPLLEEQRREFEKELPYLGLKI